jgi:hypothetical protein
MAKARAQTFADRLRPVVPREEADISHLSDQMAEVLYPGRRVRPMRISIGFLPFEGPNFPRAVELAEGAAEYTAPAGSGSHRAAFETHQARQLRSLFEIVGELPGTEVLVDGKDVPYARELWLPLFWLFVSEGY